jgi:UDP-N-acetylmuramoyl-tripeptide--D-alanyl-D-alanine ligase
MSLILFLYFLIVLKTIWKSIYFWQLKEYRFDRFKDLLVSSEGNKYFLPTRWFLRPKLTFKAILLTLITLILVILTINAIPENSPLDYFIAYLMTPFLAAISVGLFYPFSFLGSRILVWFSAKKLSKHRSNLIVIGITGSFGKTATKTILTHLLKTKYQVLSTSGSVNTPIGIALMILKELKSRHQILVVEMGAYKKGEIKAIASLVKPQIGVLTGITGQHLSLFGNLTKLKEAKFELLESLPKKNGIAVINGSNKDSAELGKKLKDVKVKFYFMPKKDYQTNLIGNWQQLNIACSVLIAKHLKVDNDKIIKGLKDIPEFKTSLKKLVGLSGATVIKNTYSANLEGFSALINYANSLSEFTKKILITSGIIELGKETEAVHHKLGLEAKSVFDQVIITRPEIKLAWGEPAVYWPPTEKLIKQLKPDLNQKTLLVLVGRMPEKIINSLCQNQS